MYESKFSIYGKDEMATQAVRNVPVSHVLLYALMAALLAVPVISGIILLRKREKGKITA